MEKEEETYHDFSNVEKQRDFLIPEEFPEGPFGSTIAQDAPVENKSTPWQEGQRFQSAFNFENKSLHEDLPRKYPGAHPTHDDPEKPEQPPYEGYGSS
ncbi:cytosolic protein [Peribacillus butanolivorans]|uniref:cytosolic protein n=1 Tax=Peribacillus butanolivorans TaxID=421767 RepID=UPI00207C6367|nr:cytosolic protein [Peribacillus butanolivorans]MCO0597714.1 cytosolic protein [Peribacillus butanolivorans]